MWEIRVTPAGDFDNHALDYEHIKVEPLSGAMGAEVVGVRLPDLSDAAFEELKQALYRHKMIYLRDQHLTHAEHEAFGARLGPFAVDAYTQGVPGHREVHPIIKEADTKVASLFGGGWHTDSPFLDEPPAITMLRSVETPPYGGDTMWANAALTLNMLDDAKRSSLDGLRVQFSMRDVLASAQANVEQRDSPIGKLAATREMAELPGGLVLGSGRDHPPTTLQQGGNGDAGAGAKVQAGAGSSTDQSGEASASPVVATSSTSRVPTWKIE